MGYQKGMDDLEEYPVGVRIRILAAQVNAAADLTTWCFVSKSKLFYSTSIREKEFLAFFQLGDCTEFMNQKSDGWDRPVILSDSIGLVWLAEHAYEYGKAGMLIVIGPMFLSKTSVKHIETALRDKVSSVHAQRQMMRTLANVPVISTASLYQYGKMLHFTLTSRRIQSSDFVYQNDRTKELVREEETEIPFFYHDSDRTAKGEKIMLQAVTDGNLNYKEIMEKEMVFNTEFVCTTGSTLRDGKNSVLIFTALCSRAAVEGGLSVKTAKEIEIRYLAEAEASQTITKLKNVMERMTEEFVRKVRESKENPLISKVTQECCDYIRANVQKPLTVESIAREMGYTTYYFTKKFSKEMGIKVTDYIKQARIEHAKIALLTTKKSIQEISDSLQFGTRNYFCKVFHEIVGMTPASYREKTGKDGEIT